MSLTRGQVEAFLHNNGYRARPAFPHIFYKPTSVGRRYVVTTLGLRRESRLSDGTWVRARSAYFKNLSLGPDGRLQGMTIRGMS